MNQEAFEWWCNLRQESRDRIIDEAYYIRIK